MLKAIFWDNDGVLVSTEHQYFNATKQVLATIGIELTQEYYYDMHFRGMSAFKLAQDSGISRREFVKLRNERNKIYMRNLVKGVSRTPGIKEVLEELHGKVRMGVVTSSRRDHFEVILNSTELAPYFEFFITKNEVQYTKPHPEPYLKALELTGLKPDECLVIEDSERGIIAAKEAGIRCFALPDSRSNPENYKRADKIMRNIKELPALVKELL